MDNSASKPIISNKQNIPSNPQSVPSKHAAMIYSPKRKSITMKNALVLAVCVAEYDDDIPNLESAKGDLSRYRDVFERDYHYEFHPKLGSKFDNKFRWKRREINSFIEEYRERLFAQNDDDEKKQFIENGKKDGLIIIFRCHGDNGKIVSSTGASKNITAIHDIVSSSGWKERADEIENIPRLFVVDACRGNREIKIKENNKEMVEAQGVDDGKQEEKANDIGSVQIERSLVASIYGNPVGYKTWGWSQSGGALSQAVIMTLKYNANSPQRFGDLLIDMNDILKTKDQLVNIEGDPALNKLVIQRNKPPFDKKLIEEINEVKQWMQQILNKEFIDFYEAVRDGVVLCDLLNAIKPNVCTPPKMPAIDISVQHLNRSEFLKGCIKMGVDHRFLMNKEALDNEENIVSLLVNLYAICITAESIKSYRGVTINRLEHYQEGGDAHDGTQWAFDEYIGRVDRSGKLYGYGKTIYKDGSWYKGGMANNKRNGWGTYHWVDGEHYVGGWKDGKSHGYGKRLYSDGNIYDGAWKEDKRHGFGKYIYKSGKVYEGEYRNNVRDGYGITIRENGSKYDGQWKDGKKHGTGTAIDSAGKIKHSGEWKNDKPVNKL